MAAGADLVAAARAWRDEDPDPATRAEVDRLLGGDGRGPDVAALADASAPGCSSAPPGCGARWGRVPTG